MRHRFSLHLVLEGAPFVQQRFRLVCWENQQRQRGASLLHAVLYTIGKHIIIKGVELALPTHVVSYGNFPVVTGVRRGGGVQR